MLMTIGLAQTEEMSNYGSYYSSDGSETVGTDFAQAKIARKYWIGIIRKSRVY